MVGSRRFALTCCVLAAMAAACADRSGDPALGKSGSANPPLTLRAGDSQPDGRPSTQYLHDFAEEVDVRSHGAIEIDVVTDASSTGAADDGPIIAGLDDGTFDLASVPTRAWAEAGATWLWALQAPFEFTSMRAMQAVATDRPLVERLTTELDARGVHPLALYPESLRFLFSVGDPVLEPADLEGAVVWSITPGMVDMLAPLGVDVVQLSDRQLAEALRDGPAETLDALESDLFRASRSDSYNGTSTAADLPVSAKFQTLVISMATWQRLDEEQRTVLQQAASAARARLLDETPDLEALAQEFCAHGGAVVTAGAGRIADFRSALQAWTSSLDPDTISSIRAITSAVAAPDPSPTCDGRTDRVSHEGDGGGFPDGTYRLEWDRPFATRWNQDHSSLDAVLFAPHDLAGLPAIITWRMSGGSYSFEIQFRGQPPFLVEDGNYSVEGDEITITLLPDIGNVTNVVRFQVADDGSVTFEQIDARPLDPYFALPWVRVGPP